MTEDPTRGGVEGTAYPATYHRELSPAWLRHAAAVNGRTPRSLDGGFRYLELGCGQGLSTVIHAAAFPDAEFHGCDRDPRCIEAACRLAADLGLDNAVFHLAPFADLLEQPLPPFDFIVAHGVYSWVDEAARADVRRLIHRLLAPAGLAYLSYNCMPGWTSEIPLRRMMVELAASATGSSACRAREAATVLGRLDAAGSAYFRLYPEATAAAQAYLHSRPDYLAHEMLGLEFVPFYSVDVADDMAQIGLALIGSATLADNHEELLVSDETASAIRDLATARQRQLAMDFAVHRRFRRDLFARAAESGATARDAAPLLVGCLKDPSAIAEAVDVPRGRVHFDGRFIRALRRSMLPGWAELADLLTTLSRRAREPQQVARNLLYLVAGGELTPFARGCAPVSTRPRPVLASPAVRQAVIRLAGAAGSGWIPSRISGGGIAMTGREAQAIIDCVEGGDGRRLPAPTLQRLLRLGILADQG